MSLAGVYQPAKEIERSKVPAALTRFLKEHSDVKEIVLHLDNDRTGRLATKAIQTVVPKKYRVKDQPPTKGKDCKICLPEIKSWINKAGEVKKSEKQPSMGTLSRKKGDGIT